MAVTPKVLYQGVPGAAAEAIAGETSKTKIIRHITIQETASAVAVVTWYLDDNGTTRNASTTLKIISLAADQDYDRPDLYFVIPAAGSFGLASTGTATVTIFGDEVT